MWPPQLSGQSLISVAGIEGSTVYVYQMAMVPIHVHVLGKYGGND